MIQINDKIRILRLDNFNLVVEENRIVVGKKTKEERFEWCAVGYYGDLKSAIGGVLKRSAMFLTEEDIKDCKELKKRLNEIEQNIISTLKTSKIEI